MLTKAGRHVVDDLGQVPEKSFYRRIGVWGELKVF